jgi:phosphoheptose isomerase
MISYLTELQQAIKSTNFAQLDTLLNEIKRARTVGNCLFVCGNGGSHAVAEHWGVDLLKVGDVNVHTLGTNQAVLTAYANDLDYEVGLSTELAQRAQPNDVLVCLSCSGSSRNIVAALREARKLRMPSFLLTGLRGPEYPEATVIRTSSYDYGILEDVFSAVGHWLTRELM